MSLLDDVGYGDLTDDCPTILAPGTGEHKGWWIAWLRSGRRCGEKEMELRGFLEATTRLQTIRLHE